MTKTCRRKIKSGILTHHYWTVALGAVPGVGINRLWWGKCLVYFRGIKYAALDLCNAVGINSFWVQMIVRASCSMRGMPPTPSSIKETMQSARRRTSGCLSLFARVDENALNLSHQGAQLVCAWGNWLKAGLVELPTYFVVKMGSNFMFPVNIFD